MRRKPLLLIALLLLVIKGAQLAADSTPLFFYDSGAFIGNALGLMFIPFRSYVYGFLIRVCCVPLATLTPLVVVQVVFGGVTAWLLAFVLIRFFNVRGWVALLSALVFAVDPVQIVHERMVMAETTTLLVLAVFLVIALVYLRDPAPHWLVALAFVGTVLVSLRTVYLPPVLASAVLVPLAALPVVSVRSRLRHAVLALAVSCGATLLFHAGYQRLTGYLGGREPGYHYSSGFFLAAAVAPILRPRDADDARAAAVIREQNVGAMPLANAGNRGEQLWRTGGLVDRLRIAFDGDERAADHAAQAMARRAILRNPAGFLKLGAITYAGYWKGYSSLPWTLAIEHGVAADAQLSSFDQAVIRTHFDLDVSQHHTLQTPSRRYHRLAGHWCYFLLVSPLAGLLALWLSPPAQRPGARLLAGSSCLLLLATCLGATDSVFRYLHPLSFTGLAAMAMLWEEALRARSPRTPSPPPMPGNDGDVARISLLTCVWRGVWVKSDRLHRRRGRGRCAETWRGGVRGQFIRSPRAEEAICCFSLAGWELSLVRLS